MLGDARRCNQFLPHSGLKFYKARSCLRSVSQSNYSRLSLHGFDHADDRLSLTSYLIIFRNRLTNTGSFS